MEKGFDHDLHGLEEEEEEKDTVVVMRSWGSRLGVVETIYEEEDQEEEEDDDNEDEDNNSKSKSLSVTPSLTDSPTPSDVDDDDFRSSSPVPPSLQNLVDSWSKEAGSKPDLVVQVQDQSFHLHRDLLVSKSGYLKRQLTQSSEVIIPSPSNITAEAFTDVMRYCYGSEIALTPLNLAGVTLAVNRLEMNGDHLLTRIATFFNSHVAGDASTAMHVLSTCLRRPMDSSMTELAGWCLAELLAAAGDGSDEWLDIVAGFSPDEFRMIATSMRVRSECHLDSLYRILDYYIENNQGKLTEEEKSNICSSAIDCSRLSPQVLAHLVQNPRLPLSFVVQAMLLDQLRTRHLIFSAAANSVSTNEAGRLKVVPTGMTLGSILHREAALRPAAHVRAAMEATAARIRALEIELASMKLVLRHCEEKQQLKKKKSNSAILEKPRSESFRVARELRVDSGHARSESFRFIRRGGYEEEIEDNNKVERMSIGKNLMHGLRNVFRSSPALLAKLSPAKSCSINNHTVAATEEKRKMPHRRRNPSFTIA